VAKNLYQSVAKNRINLHYYIPVLLIITGGR
jgi:hypothetical protein